MRIAVAASQETPGSAALGRPLPSWVVCHLQRLRRNWTFVRTFYCVLPLLFLLHVGIAAWLVGGWQADALSAMGASSEHLTVDAVLAFAQNIIAKPAVQYATHAIFALTTAVAMLAAIPLLDVVLLATEGLFRLFWRESPGSARRRALYNSILQSGKNMWPVWLVLAGWLVLWSGQAVTLALSTDTISAQFLANWLVRSCASALLVFYIAAWIHLLWLRSRRRSRHFDQYLFGRAASRHRFSSVLGVLVAVGIIVRVLVPGLIVWHDRVAAVGTAYLLEQRDYAPNWELAAAHWEPASDPVGRQILELPPPDLLPSSLRMLGPHAVRIWSQQLPLFARGMFLVLTAVVVVNVGIPAAAGAFLLRDVRRAVRSVALATLKASLLVIGVQVFIRKVFMVEPAHGFGVTGLFMLVISFFLMQQAPQMPEGDAGERSDELVA